MEVAAVACRAGLLARARPSSRARTWAVAVGPAPSAARRRLLVASLGVGEPLPAQSLGEEAVALEVGEDEDDLNSIVSVENLPPAAAHVPEARRTVRVRFVLRKQCAFGQQFLVAGDDAALGLWDPAKAISLVWSEGHVWTANTDLPANRSIEFKFLLQDASGHAHWQHGANRTLRITTETPNTVVVHEDWDHGNKQKVSEEEELSIGEDVMFPEDLAGTDGANAMPADNPEKHQNVETDSDRSAAVVADAPPQQEMVAANGTGQPQLVVDEHKTILEEVPGEENGTLSAADYAGNGSIDDDDDTPLYQGGDVLPNRPTSIFENDLAWAGKAMQQLLRVLGFQIGTTRT
uniref:Starch binding domain containing protein n=1 Tax=Zea mays TaxID=4577 RepID=B6UAF2_MAIZE|nr:starch binding domain containing protein [Zea mays]|eukprot:NP_001152198.1 starch binding domain containing protein [Zea mays]